MNNTRCLFHAGVCLWKVQQVSSSAAIHLSAFPWSICLDGKSINPPQLRGHYILLREPFTVIIHYWTTGEQGHRHVSLGFVQGHCELLGSKQMNIVLASTPGSGCRSRGDPRLGPGGRRTLALNPATQSGRMDSSTSSRSNGWP